ncbi:serine/threonine-protein kinase [Streptomyces sp. MP131-18]|uniref:serine/threonine-protein kinase n=1 Tax=Streptomyces sp. MP131-18 TaxID=1857892 RepID=UPI0009CF7E8C|nr:serine/threonine-protein kinase [Streptomyces sp. MP131-18]ONK14302.1 Serine/threonine-protein kinase PknB [Streptomyces sp. MP131-18]
MPEVSWGNETVRVLAGRYELVRFVGRGGMGEVWEGLDRVIRRRVAVKMLPHHQDEASTERFFREARVAGGLSHRGVVTVYDMGQDPDDATLFLVMEFVDGRDLAALLHEDGPPPVPTALDWAAQTAAALAAAHGAGVVHRDLKPGNLMRTAGGEIKVLDFGIARFVAATNKSSQVMGTLAYMPPERFAEQPGDARSDLYALGCVLNELLTGHTPFEATEPVSMMTAHLYRTPTGPGTRRDGVPAALDALVLRLLAKDPADRPASATEVHDELRRLGEEPPVAPTAPAPPAPLPTEGAPGGPAAPHALPTATAPPPRPGHRPSVGPFPAPAEPSPTRRRVLSLGIGAAVLAATGTAAVLLSQGDGKDTPPAADADADGAGDPAPPEVLDDRPSAPASRAWVFELAAILPNAPVVSDGVLYAAGDGTTHAIGPENGVSRWERETPGSLSLAVFGAVVYVACADGRLFALEGGTEKWVFSSGKEGSAEVVAGEEMVWLAANEALFGIDAATGEEKWHFTAEEWIDHTLTVAAGTASFSSRDGLLYAVDAVTGAVRWIVSGTRMSRPAHADGVLYVVRGSDTVQALDAAGGDEKWSAPLDEEEGLWGPSPPAVADGTVYVGGSSHLAHAFDAETGERKWTSDDAGGLAGSVPVIADGMVFVAGLEDDEGPVYALDASSGEQRWRYPTGAQVGRTATSGAPAVADGLVYVTNELGVFAIEAADGRGP